MCFDYTGKRIPRHAWCAYTDGRTRGEAVASAAEVLKLAVAAISKTVKHLILCRQSDVAKHCSTIAFIGLAYGYCIASHRAGTLFAYS